MNGYPDVEAIGVLASNSGYLTSSPSFPTPLSGGAKWIELVTSLSSSPLVPTTWIFNKGGYLDAATLATPLSSAYQADFNIEPLIRNNSGVIQYYNTYTDTWINV